MRSVIQIVRDARVVAASKEISRIENGLLVYLGVEKGDSSEDIAYSVDKISNLRVFPDKDDKMNLSVLEQDPARIMVVSQFTLCGNIHKGRRPSWNSAAAPETAEPIYTEVIRLFREQGITTATGAFQTKMEIQYTCLGPVTIIVDSRKRL